MPDFKFGDMVTDKQTGGTYMVLGPYIGEFRKNDPKGPAVWIADIDTEYMEIGEGGKVWQSVSLLERLDE